MRPRRLTMVYGTVLQRGASGSQCEPGLSGVDRTPCMASILRVWVDRSGTTLSRSAQPTAGFVTKVVE